MRLPFPWMFPWLWMLGGCAQGILTELPVDLAADVEAGEGVAQPDGVGCVADNQCLGAVCLSQQNGWPGGQCTTLSCQLSTDCHGPSTEVACLPGEVNRCVRRCQDDAQCRQGYRCLQLSNGGYCEVEWAMEEESTTDGQDEPEASEPSAEGAGSEGPLEQDPQGAPGDKPGDVVPQDRDPAEADPQDAEPEPPADPGPLEGAAVEASPEFEVVCDSWVEEEDPWGEGYDLVAFEFELPAGTQSYMVVPLSPDGWVFNVDVTGPAGTVNFLEDFPHANANAQILGSVVPVLMPFTPVLSNQVGPGRYMMRVGATGEVCHVVHSRTSAGGTVDLNLHFVGANGLNARSGAQDRSLQLALQHVEAILGRIGVRLGTTRYLDASPQTIDAYRIIRDEADAFRLVATSEDPGPSADDQLSVNLFLIDGFAVGEGGLLGLSAGLPGAAGLHGTHGSGVVFGTEQLEDPSFLAQTMAHEVGHFLGLYHTTEVGGQQADPLGDTPTCAARNWNDPLRCPDVGNLMFPLAATDAHELTAAQAQVLRSNPLVK